MDLITGGSGFIGGRLQRHLARLGHPHRVLSRSPFDHCGWQTGDLTDPASLAAACAGMERVFHCAGHAHAFTARSHQEGDQHWRVNFQGSQNLAQAAGRAGVRRFVFLSSVKAMAEPGPECVDETFPGLPSSDYGRSKRAAEEAVLAAGERYGMQVVILRLTMVYGAGGRGNLERMAQLVRRGWFPPLPETGNHRSLVHVDDVVAALCLVAADDRARGRTYIIAGPQSPSGRQLFDAIRSVLGLPRCPWYLPESALRLAASCGDVLESLLNRRIPLDSESLNRLLASAWYAPARIERELGWQAKVSIEEGLREMLGY